MNISSIVVKTTESKYQSVLEALQNSDFCEVHFHENEKIVVTVEGDSTDEEIKKLKKIEVLSGVLSAEMVYAYSEDELESERNKIELSDTVPEWLNDDSIRAEQIKYKGDLKKKI